MNVGELFVQLGVKGAEKTIGALKGIKYGLGDIGSASLETKAALVGAMYAMERLFATSGKAGTDLTNMSTLLGVSTKTLQEYEYAARQAGVSNQEVEGSFKALQNTMAKTLMGEGAPKGLARFAQLTGNISPKDIEQFAKQPQLLMQRLQEYARKETSLPLRNEVLKSFGLSDSMIAAMGRNAFRPEILRKAPAYSDSEVASLDKANIAWSNLGNKIEMAFGHFNAKHGQALVNDISMITDKVLKLAESFDKFATKLHVFEIIGKAFEGWGIIFDKMAGPLATIEKLFSGDFKERDKASTQAIEGTKGFFGDLWGVAKEAGKDMFGDMMPQTAHAFAGAPGGGPTPYIPETSPAEMSKVGSMEWLQKSIAPPTAPTPNNTTNQSVSVNQTLNFAHEGKDARKTADSVKQAAQGAYRQMPAYGQGS